LRLLLHNPNSNARLTERLGAVAFPLLLPGRTLKLSTAARGPAFIGSDATIKVARSQLYEELELRAADCDAVVLGCFGDLGIDELRRHIGKPVVSLWDAFFAVASLSGRRYGIVTTSEFWREKLKDEIRARGLAASIVAIEVVAATAEASEDTLRSAVAEAIGELATRPDVDATVLAGALLAALGQHPEGPLPRFDVLRAALSLATP
jgi:allantoin racemase